MMLDQLPYNNIHVHHAEKNQGFGASVNEAISRSDASCVLVLNSDTTSSENFLPMLCASMAADPLLAVVIPAGNDYAGTIWSGICASPADTFIHIASKAMHSSSAVMFSRKWAVLTLHLAVAIMRISILAAALISAVGDLASILMQAYNTREAGLSASGQYYKELVKRNRSLYFSRYPNASLNVLLLSGNCRWHISLRIFLMRLITCFGRRLRSLANAGTGATALLLADAQLRHGPGGGGKASAAQLAGGKAHL